VPTVRLMLWVPFAKAGVKVVLLHRQILRRSAPQDSTAVKNLIKSLKKKLYF